MAEKTIKFPAKNIALKQGDQYATLRLSPRAAVRQSTHVRTAPEEPVQLQAALVDISETGAKLKCELEIEPAEKLEMFWTPAAGIPPLMIQAECVWKNGDLVGIRFVETSDRVRSVLKSFVQFHRNETGST